MKVLQINTVSGFGSTGRTAEELGLALERKKIDMYIAYGQKSTDYRHSYKIGGKFENHIHNIFSRTFGLQGYFSSSGTRKLIDFIEEIEPDIIHLRNLHGNYLNLSMLFTFLKEFKKPIIWTLHDCWAFTGKCSHYTQVDCQKWQNYCHNCPQIKNYPPSFLLDRSEKMFFDKRKWFTSIPNMTIVCVSKWLAEEASKSFLNCHPIQFIYNWIDEKTFRPNVDNLLFERYSLSNKKKIILGVSASWKDSKINDFDNLAQLISDDYQIVLVGKLESSKANSTILNIPYIHNIEELSKLYSVAEVYVHVSLEDTFGKVIVESMACGTPVIVYNQTAIPEVVGENCGFIVEPRDYKAIYEAILKIAKVGKESFTASCVQHVKQNFNIETNINKIEYLYKSMSES